MQGEHSLKDWNWAVLMLTQALLGAISPNFEKVYLYHSPGSWIVRVILSEDDPEDRDEIEDVIDQFAIYLDECRFVDDAHYKLSDTACLNVAAEIMIAAEAPADAPPEPYRLVFSMRNRP